jgi:hypothetical protein
MFNESIYTQEYYQLVNFANTRVPSTTKRAAAKKILGYVESHHIIPESLGGDNTVSNKVWLTAEEHVKAHILLTKMVDREDHRRKMHMAAVRMITPQNIGREREVILEDIISKLDTSELDKIREESARLHSEHLSKKYQGEGNPFYGKTHTDESNKSRSKRLKGRTITEEHRKATSDGRLKNSAHISAIVTGTKNPRYNPTIYNWENINTGENKSATRLEMITADPTLKSGISGVITGKAEQYKGWRIVK